MPTGVPLEVDAVRSQRHDMTDEPQALGIAKWIYRTKLLCKELGYSILLANFPIPVMNFKFIDACVISLCMPVWYDTKQVPRYLSSYIIHGLFAFNWVVNSLLLVLFVVSRWTRWWNVSKQYDFTQVSAYFLPYPSIWKAPNLSKKTTRTRSIFPWLFLRMYGSVDDWMRRENPNWW